jgi:hypothetical protein
MNDNGKLSPICPKCGSGDIETVIETFSVFFKPDGSTYNAPHTTVKCCDCGRLFTVHDQPLESDPTFVNLVDSFLQAKIAYSEMQDSVMLSQYIAASANLSEFVCRFAYRIHFSNED